MPTDTNLDRAIYDLLSKQCPAMWLGFPIGPGDVYWVNGYTGSDAAANPGTSPDQPLATITEALDRCTAWHNDYIMVLASDEALEDHPIAVNKIRVHILGIPSSFGGYNACFVRCEDGTNGAAIFTINELGQNSEIAFLDIGGGDANAGIELDQAMGVWIHDCHFGHEDCADDPLNGILFHDRNSARVLIENCRFFGACAAAGSRGRITNDGVTQRAVGSQNSIAVQIRKNIFQAIPNVAINMYGGFDAVIDENLISCDEDLQGAAITLANNVVNTFISRNRAMFGDSTPALGTNPYLDQAAADRNHWVDNWAGNGPVDPA